MGGKVSKQSIGLEPQPRPLAKNYEKKLVLPKQLIADAEIEKTTIINDYTFIRTSQRDGPHQLHIFKQDSYLRSMPLHQRDSVVFVTESHFWLEQYTSVPLNNRLKHAGSILYNFKTNEFLYLPVLRTIYKIGTSDFAEIQYCEIKLAGQIMHLRLFSYSFRPRDYIPSIDGNKFWAAYDLYGVRDVYKSKRLSIGLVQFEIKDNFVAWRMYQFELPDDERLLNMNYFFPYCRNRVLYFYASQQGMMMGIAEIDEARGKLRPLSVQNSKIILGCDRWFSEVHPSDDASHVTFSYRMSEKKKFFGPYKHSYSCYQFLSLDEDGTWHLNNVDPNMPEGRLVAFLPKYKPMTYKIHNDQYRHCFQGWLRHNYFCLEVAGEFQIFKVAHRAITYVGTYDAPKPVRWRSPALCSDGYAVWACRSPSLDDEKNAMLTITISLVPYEITSGLTYKQTCSSLYAFFQHTMPRSLLDMITEFAVDSPSAESVYFSQLSDLCVS